MTGCASGVYFTYMSISQIYIYQDWTRLWTKDYRAGAVESSERRKLRVASVAHTFLF